ncbi:type II secretion system protein GspM [Isoalcanivorax beigongshangi]|uniref:Type II secretion system protein M n=1 Tax=Isoalcanivorax beigongshangi TaxID=3238810 RepID=A0ABV4AGJ3_9GAMM
MKNNLLMWRQRATTALEPAQAWFAEREAREQRLLVALAITAVLFLLYGMVWAPTVQARDAARQRYLSQAQVVNWIEDNAAVVRQAGAQSNGGTPHFSGDWISLINSSATQTGLTLRGYTPDGSDAVRVQLEQQVFARVVIWFQQLEQEQGIRVSSLEISASQQPGTVNVRATLRRGA